MTDTIQTARELIEHGEAHIAEVVTMLAACLSEIERVSRAGEFNPEDFMGDACIPAQVHTGNATCATAFLMRQMLGDGFGPTERKLWIDFAEALGPGYVESFHNRAVYLLRNAQFEAK